VNDYCFIYGSVHAEMPRRDVVECVLGVVDYVLLEGLGVRNWRELVRRDWRTVIVVVGLLTYFKILHLLTKIAGLYYRLRYGIDFKGDMMYVAELARRRVSVSRLLMRTCSVFTRKTGRSSSRVWS